MSDKHEIMFAFSAIILLFFSIISLPFVTSMACGLRTYSSSVISVSKAGGNAMNTTIEHEWQQHGCFPEKDCFQQGAAPNSSHVLWKRNFLATLHPPIIVNGQVIGGATLGGAESASGFLYSLDQNTGETVWMTNIPDPLNSGWPYGNKLMKIDEQHFMYVQEGTFAIYEIETGRPVLRFKAGDYLGAPGLYLPEKKTWFGVGSFTEYLGQTVEAWDFSDILKPKMLWRSEPLEQVDLRLNYENGRLHVGSYDYAEYCFDAETGKILWQQDMRGITCYYGAAAYGKVFRGSINNYLWAFDPADGRVLWEFRPTGYGGFSGGIAAAYGKVYMLNADGYLYAVDAETGKEAWKYRALEPNSTEPAVIHNANAYGAIADGKVYWLVADSSLTSPNTGSTDFVCLDANTGKEVWHSYEAEMRCPAIAYGKLFGQSWTYGENLSASDWKIANQTSAYLWCFGKGATSLKIGTDTRDLYGIAYITQGEETSIIGNATDLSPANNGVPARNMSIKLSWQLPDGTTGKIGEVYTDENGKFFFKWVPPISGTYTIIAESSGNDAYAAPPTVMTTLAVNSVQNFSLIQPISIAVIIVIIIILIISLYRRKKR